MQQENQNTFSIFEARQAFMKMRNSLERIVATTPERLLSSRYGKAFGDIYTEATLGDIVAQDFLGYIFKRRRENLVPENIDLSMQWLILAAANGNPLSLERLAIFLNSAYDEILRHSDFDYIKDKNNLTPDVFTPVVGKLICEAIVDELGISALKIIKEVPTELRFNNRTMNIYDNARNKVLPVVIKFLKGENPYSEK